MTSNPSAIQSPSWIVKRQRGNGAPVGQEGSDARLVLVEEAPAGVHAIAFTNRGAPSSVCTRATKPGEKPPAAFSTWWTSTADLVLDRGPQRRGQVGPVDASRHGSRVAGNGYASRMEAERSPRPDEHKSPEELAEEVKEENPDPVTRREAFELGLMDEDESVEGEEIHVVSDEELEP